MRLTLKVLLSEDHFNEAVVLAGDCGLERSVKAIFLGSEPEALGFAGSNDLVICEFDVLAKDGAMSAIFPALAMKQPAGICFKKSLDFSDLPFEIRNMADNRCLPLFCFEDNHDWNLMLARIIHRLVWSVSDGYGLAKNLYTIQNLFLKAIEEGMGIEGTLKILACLTGKPCSITDANGILLFTDPAGYLPPLTTDLTDLTRRIAVRGIPKPLGPCYVTSLGDNLYLHVWETSTNHQLYPLIMNQAARMIALEFRCLKAYRFSNENHLNPLLQMLLDSETPEVGILHNRLTKYWSFQEPYLVALIKIQACESSLNKWYGTQMLSHFKKMMVGLGLNLFTCMDDKDRVVCLLPVAYRQPVVSALQTARELYFHNLNISIGLSEKKESLQKFHIAYKEAAAALELENMAGKNDGVLSFSGLGFLRFALGPDRQIEIKRFLDRTLQPITQYDELHKTDFVNTLRIFIAAGCNYKLAAKQLFLHPNTIRYRIAQTHKLSKEQFEQLEFDDWILNLQIALRLADLNLPAILET